MAQMFPSMKDVYGTVIHAPKANDVNLYKEFSTIGHNAGCGTAPIDRERHRLLGKQRLLTPLGPDSPRSRDQRQQQQQQQQQQLQQQLQPQQQQASNLNPTSLGPPSTNLMTVDEMKQSTTVLIQRSVFSLDNSRQVMPPTVKRSNRDVYEQYVARANGPQDPSPTAMKKYQDYVSLLYK